jgi:hypothetical protein
MLIYFGLLGPENFQKPPFLPPKLLALKSAFAIALSIGLHNQNTRFWHDFVQKSSGKVQTRIFSRSLFLTTVLSIFAIFGF